MNLNFWIEIKSYDDYYSFFLSLSVPKHFCLISNTNLTKYLSFILKKERDKISFLEQIIQRD